MGREIIGIVFTAIWRITSLVIMTSFIVNYYLTGLHWYTTGDSVPIPIFVYISIAVMVIISSLSYMKFNKDKKPNLKE